MANKRKEESDRLSIEEIRLAVVNMQHEIDKGEPVYGVRYDHDLSTLHAVAKQWLKDYDEASDTGPMGPLTKAAFGVTLESCPQAIHGVYQKTPNGLCPWCTSESATLWLTAVERAWNDPGTHPSYHDRARVALRDRWPVLARALDALLPLQSEHTERRAPVQGTKREGNNFVD